MQIFIDSADIEEIRDAAAMGVIDGVTTNPSLVAKTGRPFKELVDIYEVVRRTNPRLEIVHDPTTRRSS